MLPGRSSPRSETVSRAVRGDEPARRVSSSCAGYVETPDEIAALLKRTSPELLGLVFDTGHYAFGAGDQDGSLTRADWSGCGQDHPRNYKDCEPAVAAQSASEGWNYFYKSVGAGVFCELGQGFVDFTWTTRLRERATVGL